MYYFVSFMYNDGGVGVSNGVVEKHPIDWQLEIDTLQPGKCVLINWKEISVLEYNKYKDAFLKEGK